MSPLLSKIKRNSIRGVSLTELLVILTVIGVLAVLLTPTLASIRNSSYKASCLSNLRQVAAAGLMFANENNGGLPTSSFNRQVNGMMDYLGYDINYVGESVLTCPALQKTNPTRAHHYRTTSINLVATQGHSSSKKNLRSFAEPSRTIFFLDGLINPSAPDKLNGRFLYNYHFGALNLPEFEDRFRFAHGNHCNVVYLDGHAEGLSAEKLLDWSTQSVLWRSR